MLSTPAGAPESAAVRNVKGWRSFARMARGLALGVAIAVSTPAGAASLGAPTRPALAQKPFLSALLDPSSVPADGSTVSALYLELLGAAGNAVSLGTPTPVTLVSSDPSVVTVPPAVTIPAGSSTITVPVTTSRTPGSATIEASVHRLASSAVTLTTTTTGVGSTGGSIKLSVSPAAFFRGSAGPAWATAELVDSAGSPELARSAVALDVISSAPWVLRPPAVITVPAGSYMATVPLRIGSPGAVTLSALGDGFNPGIVATHVGVAGTAPAGLQATLQPALLLPGTAPRLVLQAVDRNGDPVPFPCGPVFLSSNTLAVLDVPTTATPSCASDSEAVVVDASAAATSGTASITVAKAGLTPVTVQAHIAGSTPEALTASVAPLAFAYGESPEGWLVLQTVIAKGEPADAVTPVAITLAGGAGAVPSSATIPAGASTVAVPITGLSTEGPTIVASASGFKPVEVTLTPVQRALIRGAAGGGSAGPGITVMGHRIPLGWIFLAQVVAVAWLGLGLLLSARRRRRRQSA